MFIVNRNPDSLPYKNSDMSIGKRVRGARKDAKLTQQQLAEKVGIKQSTLSELENGDSAGTGYVASMAAALGVNALWLQTGKGPKKSGLPQESDLAATSFSVPMIAKEIAELIMLYGHSDPGWRKKIIDLARIGAAQSKGESSEAPPPAPSE